MPDHSYVSMLRHYNRTDIEFQNYTGTKNSGSLSSTESTFKALLTDDTDTVTLKSTTPGYRRGLKPLPINGYARIFQSGERYVSFSWKATRLNPGYHKYDFRGIWKGGFNVPTFTQLGALYSLQKSVAENEAKARFASHIANIEYTAMQDIGESKETVALLINTVKRAKSFANLFSIRNDKSRKKLIKLYKKYSADPKGNRKALGNLALSANSMFLEYQFGWKPLAGSIQDIVKVLDSQMNGGPRPRSKVSGHGSFSDMTYETMKTGKIFIDPIAFDVQLARIFEYNVLIGGLLKPNQEATSFAQQIGLTPDEIVPTIWAILSKSFIADYFANIGDCINNIKQSPQRMQPETLFINRIITYRTLGTVATPSMPPVSGLNLWTSEPGKFLTPVVHEMKTFSRSPISVGNTYVSFNLRDPSRDQVVKTLSVAAAMAFSSSKFNKL